MNSLSIAVMITCLLGMNSALYAVGPVTFIDLQPYANQKLNEGFGTGHENNNLRDLPRGEQILGDCKFQIGEGLLQLGSTVVKKTMPEKIDGIKVDRKFTKLHILQATHCGGGPIQPDNAWYVKDGTLIGEYRVNFDDQSAIVIPIVYGEEVRDWFYVNGDKEPGRSVTVWSGENGYSKDNGSRIRLYETTWTNPWPDKKITTIDFSSKKSETPAAPFCVAMTGDGEQAAVADLKKEDGRTQSEKNLKQLMLAMHNYLDARKSFPPAYNTKPGGDGTPLLSWRVQLLPYLDEVALYRQFKFDEPWDSENNKQLIEKMPAVFKAPRSKAAADFKTVYLTPRGKDTVFPGDKPIRLKDIPDGTSRTICILEAADEKAVVWTKPDDDELDGDNPAAGLIGLHADGFLSAFCDGAVHFIPKTINKETLRLLFSRNDGHAVQPVDYGAAADAPVAPPVAAAAAVQVQAMLDRAAPVVPLPGIVVPPAPVFRAAIPIQAIRAANAQPQAAVHQLQLISVAMLKFEESSLTLPAAYAADPQGKPLLSWRVALLPFLGQAELASQFHFDEPWDSENNKKLIEKMPAVYKVTGSKAAAEFKTPFLTVRHEHSPFPGRKATPLASIIDGTAKTILVVEASDDKAVIWTKPDDFEPDAKNPISGLVGLVNGAFLASFCDGHVQVIPESVDVNDLNALFTRDGNEPTKVSTLRTREMLSK